MKHCKYYCQHRQQDFVYCVLVQGDRMSPASYEQPSLLPAVVAQSVPAAYAAAGVAGPAAAAAAASQLLPAPPGLQLAPEASAEQKHALACLHSLLEGLKADLWKDSAPILSPCQLLQHLENSCWAAVRSQDSFLMKLLLQVIQALAQAVIGCLADPNLWQDPEEEEEQGAAALDAHECKETVLVCLKLLLVQLPCSAAVPVYSRALALEVSNCDATTRRPILQLLC